MFNYIQFQIPNLRINAGNLLWTFEVTVDNFVRVQILHSHGNLFGPRNNSYRLDDFFIFQNIL